MRRSQRLEVVVDMAEREKQDAAKKLRNALMLLASETERLGAIEDYYNEYEKNFARQIINISADILSQNRQILCNLSDTLTAQREKISLIDAQAEAAKKHWSQCHLRHENLKNLVKDMENNEARARDILEQKLMDELTGQSYARTRR